MTHLCNNVGLFTVEGVQFNCKEQSWSERRRYMLDMHRSRLGEDRVGGGGGEEDPRSLGLASLGIGKPCLVS